MALPQLPVYAKVIGSLIAVWCLAYLGPSRKNLSDRISTQVSRLPSIQVDLHPYRTQRDRYNATKLAMIVEPATYGHMASLILHTIAVAPPDWPFLFVGTEESVAALSVSGSIMEHQRTGKLIVATSPYLGFDLHDREHLSRALTNTRFYDALGSKLEWLFRFHQDTILCAKSLESLNQWLDYDWLSPTWDDRNRHGGSGDFSIRRVSRVKRVLSFQERTDNTEQEDEFLGSRLGLLPGARMMNPRVADQFAVQMYWADQPMGYRIGDWDRAKERVWNDNVHRKMIWDYCPEIKMILPMKLERERCAPNQEGSPEMEEKHREEAKQRQKEELEEKNKQEANDKSRVKAEDDKNKGKRNEERRDTREVHSEESSQEKRDFHIHAISAEPEELEGEM